MARTIQDEDLLFWEAYASSGEAGYPARAKLVFQCLSDATRRARFLTREGDRSEVEQELRRSTDAELQALLEESQPVS